MLGTMIWDTIAGRDGPKTVEEWGGIGYSLAALSASLPEGWTIRPLVKVGRDLAANAHAFLREIPGVANGARFVEVPAANPRVSLRYEDAERRCEGLTGGVPPWTWEELGPMVLGLDALYANFITGFECDLPTMQLLRRGFAGPLYGDLHSLALGIRPDGTRYLRPVDEALAWLECFDIVQLNEDEMTQLGEEPLALAARALTRGTKTVCVTLGARGAVYVTSSGSLVHTALVANEGGPLEGDPTGCGDVFGGTMVAELIGGADLEHAIRAANRMARRNVSHRGASGLHLHLRGALQIASA